MECNRARRGQTKVVQGCVLLGRWRVGCILLKSKSNVFSNRFSNRFAPLHSWTPLPSQHPSARRPTQRHCTTLELKAVAREL